MKNVKIKAQRIDRETLESLHARGLIVLLKPTDDIAANPQKDGVSTIYSSRNESGSHKLICVRKAQTEIVMTVHDESEEVLFVGNDTGARPLYLILGLCSVADFEAKALSCDLCDDDLLALEIDYTNCECLVFSIPPTTPHCEVTVAGDAPAPIFFVTEPTDIKMRNVSSGSYVFELIP